MKKFIMLILFLFCVIEFSLSREISRYDSRELAKEKVRNITSSLYLTDKIIQEKDENVVSIYRNKKLLYRLVIFYEVPSDKYILFMIKR